MERVVQIEYAPFEWQRKVHEDQHRFRVIVSGRRAGKSTMAINELIKNAFLNPNGLYWYIAPTYRQAKQIAWKILLHYLPRPYIRRKQETTLSVELFNGASIELKGAENEDSLRGVGIHGMVVDEYASMPKEVWDKVLRPELSDTQGWAMFIGTPSGYNHFHRMAKLGDHAGSIEGDAFDDNGEKIVPDQNYQTFRFPTTANPKIPQEEIEEAKMQMTDAAFGQEYLAGFQHFTGRVYKEFDRRKHVIDPFEVPLDWPRYRSIDFGYNSPVACLWLAIDPLTDTVYVTDELYRRYLTTDDLIAAVKTITGSMRIRQTFGDPKMAQVIADLRLRGVPISPANNDIVGGVAKVSEYMKIQPGTGKPKLFIFGNCINLVKEIEGYRWDEKRPEKNEKELPIQEHDHAADALRYFLFTVNKPDNTIDDRVMAIMDENRKKDDWL